MGNSEMFVVLSGLTLLNLFLGIFNANTSHISSYNFYASYFNFFVAGFAFAGAIDIFVRG